MKPRSCCGFVRFELYLEVRILAVLLPVVPHNVPLMGDMSAGVK